MSKIFISHAVADGATLAVDLVHQLEQAGNPCWIAPRDVVPGRTYPAQIMGALRGCRAALVLVTPAANDSPDVLQEVQIAHANRKMIVPIVVGGTAPSDDLGYFLGVRHQIAWTEAGRIVAALVKAIPPLEQAADPAPALATIDAPTAVAKAAATDAGVTGIFSITVRATDIEGYRVWLNSEADYRDPRCLSIAVAPTARRDLASRLGGDPSVVLKGRAILVHGTANKRRIDFISGGVPTGHYYFQTHVDVADASQIELAD